MSQEHPLHALAERWTRLAQKKFDDAGREQDTWGKRLIEHGAMCYLNCATDLKEALQRSSPTHAADPAGRQTS